MNFLKLIKKNRLFGGFEEDEINAIFDCLKGRIVRYGKGAVIAETGKLVEEIGILLEGSAITFERTAKGIEPKRALEAGDMFGEVEGYLTKNVLPYSVMISSEDATVLYITVSTIVCQCEKQCPWHHKLLTNTLNTLAEEVGEVKSDAEYLAIKSMRLKIAKLVYETWLVQKTKQISLGKNRNEMAEYLNVSRPSMSREMMRMRDEGIIDFWKDKITVLDLDKLKAIVNQ